MSEANRSVLLVDDDPAILRIVSHWIEHAGYEVRTASNGSEALFQIDAKCPNFLITDWDMPVMDGVALCGALSERRLPHYVYTLFLTARSDSEDMIKAIELGADDFVVKPIGRGEILARLRAGARVLEMESRLRLLANTDPLTGLSCKRSFREQVRREWNVCKVPANAVSCVILDIDFFKKVNDTHGHPAGDEALRSIGKLIAANCRANDVVCRYGGDEFSAMLPGANENEAAAWAERLRQTVAKTPIHIAGSTIQITASFGVAQRFDDSQSFDELTAAADQCLLLAKQLGRNRVVRFSDLKDHGETPQFDRRQIVDPFRGVLARDVMTPVVAGISLGSSLESLADYFLDFRINSAPVVDANGKLVGIVSEKDLMQEMQRPAGWAQSVDDVMKTNVVSYSVGSPAKSIYDFLCRISIRCVIVVSGGAPVGYISRGSLLRWRRNATRLASDAPAALAAEPFGSRAAETAAAICRQSNELLRAIESARPGSRAAEIIGGASKIQELTADLLGCSRQEGPSLFAALNESDLQFAAAARSD